jgi:hypothetical protein
MTTKVRIYCIHRPDRFNQHRHITHIGGINADKTRWKLTEEEAIKYIENVTYSFYVFAGGSSVDVIVAKSRSGNKYLKTVADGEIPDNLLSLPECP